MIKLNGNEFSKYIKYRKAVTTKCPKCGHKVFTAAKGFGICRYCSTKVIDKRITFRENLKKAMEG